MEWLTMRMVVFENKLGEVAVREMLHPLSYYESKYNVLTVVNKLKNPYHVKRIRAYYKSVPISERKYQSRVLKGTNTDEFIEKVEYLGFETIKGILEEDGKEIVDVIFICKGNCQLVAHVGLTKMWVFRNDYLGFDLLSEKEKRKLMPILLDYISTETIDRITSRGEKC